VVFPGGIIRGKGKKSRKSPKKRRLSNGWKAEGTEGKGGRRGEIIVC